MSIQAAAVPGEIASGHKPDAELLARVGRLSRDAVVQDDGAGAALDATGEDPVSPRLMFRPRTTAEVAAILAACSELRRLVVVQGGLTGQSGGATPRPGEVALSLSRMVDLGTVDPNARTVLAGAGVPLQRVQRAAEAADLSFPVDIGARGTATIGGIVATNAGGLSVIRHGMVRAHVAGLEAVLADGRVIGTLNGLTKDNAGYDLKQLFIGSEGTLGVVTRVLLRLAPAAAAPVTAFLALDSVEAALTLLSKLRRATRDRILACEMISGALFDRVVAAGRSAPVASAPVLLLVEAEEPAQKGFEAALMDAIETGAARDVVLAASGRERAGLWSIREGCPEAVSALPAVVGFDVGVPPALLPRFLEEAGAVVAAVDPCAPVLPFGHLGDGNLHYIVATDRKLEIERPVYEVAASVGGTVAAEHGLGRLKPRWLPLVRSEAEIATMRAIKAALDPNHILNPGRVLPSESEAP